MNTKQLSIIAAQYGLHSPQYNTALNEYVKQQQKRRTGKGVLSTLKKGVKRGLSVALKIALYTSIAITSIIGSASLLTAIHGMYEVGNVKNIDIMNKIIEILKGSGVDLRDMSSLALNKVVKLVKEYFDAKFKTKTQQGKGIYKKVKKHLSSALKVALVLGAVLAILSGGTYRYGDAIKARLGSKYVDSVVNRNKSVIDNSIKNVISQVEKRTGYKLTGNELTKLWTMLKELIYGKSKGDKASQTNQGTQLPIQTDEQGLYMPVRINLNRSQPMAEQSQPWLGPYPFRSQAFIKGLESEVLRRGLTRPEQEVEGQAEDFYRNQALSRGNLGRLYGNQAQQMLDGNLSLRRGLTRESQYMDTLGDSELDELDPPIVGTTTYGKGIRRMKNKSRHLNLN